MTNSPVLTRSAGKLLHFVHHSERIFGGPVIQPRKRNPRRQRHSGILLPRPAHLVLYPRARKSATRREMGLYSGLHRLRDHHGVYDGATSSISLRRGFTKQRAFETCRSWRSSWPSRGLTTSSRPMGLLLQAHSSQTRSSGISLSHCWQHSACTSLPHSFSCVRASFCTFYLILISRP